MARQVNLARKELLSGFGKVQLPTFTLCILISFVFAALWVGYAWYQQQQLLDEEAKVTAIVESHLAALNKFQQQNPSLGNEQRLTEYNQQLSAQLQLAREAYSGLANQVENAIDGFSNSLQQLADYDLNGLWLDTILLKDGQRFFSIQGYARDPKLIPNYIAALGKSTFNGISVDQLSVSKEEGQKELWRFMMSNDRPTNEHPANSSSTNNSSVDDNSLDNILSIYTEVEDAQQTNL